MSCSAQSKHKRLHLFDTFAGMPATDREKDWHRPGDFADTSLEKVTETLSGFNRISFYQGLFPDTADPMKTSTFCFVRMDVILTKEDAETIVEMEEVCYGEGIGPDSKGLLNLIAKQHPGLVIRYHYLYRHVDSNSTNE